MKALFAVLVVCLVLTSSPIRAQDETAATPAPAVTPAKSAAQILDDIPPKTDYGSPSLKQELRSPTVFMIRHVSSDKEYGYTIEKPIMVGGGIEGPMNEQRFLNALAGPGGEAVTYKRRGSGHFFKTDNGLLGDGVGVLDMYEVTYPGLDKPAILFLNMYDSDTLMIPVGFTSKYPMPTDE